MGWDAQDAGGADGGHGRGGGGGGGSIAANGSSKIAANKALSLPDFEDSEMQDTTDGDASHPHTHTSPSSTSSSSRKRPLVAEGGETGGSSKCGKYVRHSVSAITASATEEDEQEAMGGGWDGGGWEGHRRPRGRPPGRAPQGRKVCFCLCRCM